MFNRAISPWWTVASGTVSGIMNAGTVMVYAFGILTLGLMKEFGWSREVIASAFTAFLIGSGVGLAGLGWLISRFGIRAPSAVLAATAALSLVAVGVMPPSPILLAMLLLLVGIGGAATTAFPFSIAISGFFDARRGVALGIAVSGSGLGAMLLPQLAHYTSTQFGWRAGFIIIGALMGAILVTSFVLFVRTPPGIVERNRREPAGGIGRRTLRQTYWGNRSFWLILVPILAVSVATFGALGTLVLFCKDKGFAGETIAWIFSMIGLVSLVGKLVVGYLLDRFFAPYVTATIFLIAASGLVVLTVGSSVGVVGLGAVCLGLALGAEADVLAYLVSRYFPLVEVSRVTGINYVAWAWGGAFGTPLAAASFARLGSYVPAYGLFAAVLVVGALLVARIGPYLNLRASGSHAANARAGGDLNRLAT
jgi:MFS family permease